MIDYITVDALENFTLNLSAAVNATIGNAAATATIVDDDSPAPIVPIAINGTTGNDVLKGTEFADTITGDAGNDVLDGGAGGDGNDIYLIEDIGDTYVEALNNGIDLVISYLATHTLAANVENLILAGTAVTGIGNNLNNTITGNSAANTLNGSAGADTMTGGLGNDTYVVDNALDVVTESLNGGTDLIQSGVTYTLSANVENLSLTGVAIINGNGNVLNNTLTGNGVANTLNGGAGDDAMSGGLGNDTYIVDNSLDTVSEVES